MIHKSKPKAEPPPKKVAVSKAVPKKKTVIEKVEKLLEPAEKVTPPDAVIVESTKIIDSGAPNEKYPYGIKFITANSVSYERYDNAKKRDKRFKVAAKDNIVESLDYKAAGATAVTATLPPPVPTPGAGKGPKLVTTAPVEPGVSRRVTPGAKIVEWRIARSVRVGQPGFFLQGGFYENKDGTGKFTVGAEEHFTDLHKAKLAKVAKLPPSDDPVITKVN